MSTNENISPKVIREIAKELKSLHDSPPEGIKVLLSDDNVCTIFAEIEGPVETPYEGGLFKMKLVLSSEFPNSPPKGYFLTRIFHPNIAKNGEICVNTLKKDWRPTLGIRHILLVIRCLLIEPYPESALNEDAGKLLMENYEEYAKHARLMTSIHAAKSKSKNPLKSECNMDSSISSISTPLAAKVTNTDNGSNTNLHLNSSLTSASYQDPALSGLKKIKNDSGVRASSSDKQRKTDTRKKNLKRL